MRFWWALPTRRSDKESESLRLVIALIKQSGEGSASEREGSSMREVHLCRLCLGE